ncbi:carboxy terminal-processing peptidase [Colwellia sp. E2M01]|uniref:carboxy terminal-processing peptidase n=1 Tax=Colwellia sp. E2M01 TaxID=2841561 RepID=UPI001C093EC1|nr:carboxy terminal-processing peptidase [Colwellia sp. E2M01]MBU2871648.1 carboxy terminal-processing peptidase [Colwellia sp. E2M01]
MQKVCRIALAISLSLGLSANAVAFEKIHTPEELPVLIPESQHAIATKRVTARFSRAHYKKIAIDNALSAEIFDRFIKQLDYARNVFLASDIESFQQYRNEFDTVLTRGKLEAPYAIYNINMQRRLERYEYAINLLDTNEGKNPFDFTKKDVYLFDREDEPWAKSEAELNELWRLKVKFDVLNLTLTKKEWPKVKEILTKRYNYAIKRLKQSESEDAFQLVMNSFSRVVEPHTSYLSPRNAERFQVDMNLSLEGIGAELRSEEDYTVIQRVITGGPADKSNQLKSKDRIVGVAQDKEEFEDVIGWRLDDVVELIKGPKGTKVRLQILSGDSDDEANIKVVSIVRDIIKLEDRAAKSEVYLQNPEMENSKKLGVITIPSFYNNLSTDVKKEIASLKEAGVEGIIVDLRGNGGGSLPESSLLTGLFIDKGPVVQIRDGANRIEVQGDRDGISYFDGPLTVMVDRYSASASEIFSAAIQDYGRGVIIGEHTFGKGTVQQHRGLGRVYDLYEKPLGSIQYTIAKFYRINGGSTQHRGVLPDIAFPTAIDPEDWGESKEENALPWDQIQRAKYTPLNDLSKDVEYLTARYQERIKTNPEFNYLLEDISVYQAEKDDKTISLNLVDRQTEREESKAKRLIRVNKQLALLGKEKITDLDDLTDELDEVDPFLDEAARITFDFIELGKVAKK